MDKTKATKDLENKTLTIERTFDASKDAIWKFYAEKEWFEKWWGPEGWETTVREFDFRPGGKIHYGMKCVDENQKEWFGQESWGLMHLEAVDEPNSFSATDNFCDLEGTINEQMVSSRFEVELVEDGSQTRLVSRSITETAEQLEELVKMGMIEGFASQLNKLEKLVTE